MAALTGLTVGTPDNSYLSLIKFTDNLPLTASLKSLSDGQGNVLGIKISTSQISIDSPIIFSSLTASKLVYLNGSNILTTIADGTNGQVLTTNGAGVYSFTTVSGGGGITINSTAITSGTAGRILFENASNQVSEAAGLTYASGLFTVLGTTQQAKFAYDASNHLGITIASNGSATFALTGTTPLFSFSQAATIATSVTTPLLIGGSGTTQTLILKTTTGVGAAGADMIFQVGNNGAKEAMRILNSGFVGIGLVAPTAVLHVRASGASSATSSFKFEDSGGNEKFKIRDDGIFNFTGTTRQSGTFVVGTSPSPVLAGACASLEVVSTTTGFLNSRLTTTQMNAVSTPLAGLQTYNTTFNNLVFYNGTAWVQPMSNLYYDASNYASFTVGATGSLTIGLTGTSPTFRINNAVSINTSAQPTSVLDVKYTSGGIDTLKLTDTGNWIISFYQGATQRAGFDNYGRTWNTLNGNAIFNAGTGTIGFNQNSVNAFTSTGTGAVSGTLQLLTGFVGVGVAPTVKFHVLATTEQIRAAYDASNYASFTVGATGSLTIGLTGTAPRTTFSQGVTMGGTLRKMGYTVATLPGGVVGDTAYVTDATAPTYLGALTGGGAVTCPVFYNGSAWVSA